MSEGAELLLCGTINSSNSSFILNASAMLTIAA